jgi:hypothetical protein
MTIESLSAIVGFVLIIGGMGWKLNSELSSIKTMLQVFIATSEAKFAELMKLEKRIEKLEERMTECYKEKH